MRLFSESATNTWLPATAIPPPGGSVGFWEEPKWNSPRPVPLLPQAPMKAPLGGELLDPVVARVDHVHVAGGVYGQRSDRSELAGAGPEEPHSSMKAPAGLNFWTT